MQYDRSDLLGTGLVLVGIVLGGISDATIQAMLVVGEAPGHSKVEYTYTHRLFGTVCF